RELLATGDPVKAVVAAVSAMELDDEAFNAGVGGAPTRDGRVELDACVMAGDGSAGAVAAVTNSRNPVRLAEKVRTSTPHVILAGEGAERLEEDPVPNESLLTDRMREELARWRERGTDAPGRGTVGALALADDGRLAAALVRARGDGGFIDLGRHGPCGFAYSTPLLAVAYRAPGASYRDVQQEPGVHLFPV